MSQGDMSVIDSMFKEKVSYLTNLVREIQGHNITELNNFIYLKKVERVLQAPYIATRKWSKETFEKQAAFAYFLETYILVYEKVLQELKGKMN